jgi:uncharacterized protein YjbJ (UPF0337 family)
MGIGENIKGTIKEKAGEVFDDKNLEEEGNAQQERGEEEARESKARAEAKAHEKEADALAERQDELED